VSDVTETAGIGTWTKINELAYTNGSWANEKMELVNMTYEFNLPARLTTGDYLVWLNLVPDLEDVC
jgi:cellulase